MHIRILGLLVAGTLLVSCSQQPVEVTREIIVTREVVATQEVTREVHVEVTREVQVTVPVEVTRIAEVTPVPSPTPTQIPVVEAGESVQHGRWKYSVAEVRRTEAMKGSFETKYAGGEYVVVFLNIQNTGSMAEQFDEEFLVLEDDQGRKFAATESLLAHHYYNTQYWYLDDFQPGAVYVIPLAYDVALDAEKLVLRPADSPTPAIRLP